MKSIVVPRWIVRVRDLAYSHWDQLLDPSLQVTLRIRQERRESDCRERSPVEELGVDSLKRFLLGRTPRELGQVHEYLTLGNSHHQDGTKSYKNLVVVGQADYVDKQSVVEVKARYEDSNSDLVEGASRQLLIYLWLFGKSKGHLLVTTFAKGEELIPVQERSSVSNTYDFSEDSKEVETILDGVIVQLGKRGIELRQ